MSVEMVILQGNVGNNSGLRTVGANNSQVCDLTLAVNQVGKEEPKWHDLVCWGKTAEIASKFCDKGREILVVGRIQKRPYEKDGEKRVKVEIVVDELYLDTASVTVVKGRVGQNDGLREANSGKKVCNITVAVDGRNKDNPPEWFRVSLWDKTAEIAAEYAEKGRMVTVIGRMQTRSYEKNGEKKFSTELMGNQLILGRRPKPEGGAETGAHDSQAAASARPAQSAPAAATALADDDLDF